MADLGENRVLTGAKKVANRIGTALLASTPQGAGLLRQRLSDQAAAEQAAAEQQQNKTQMLFDYASGIRNLPNYASLPEDQRTAVEEVLSKTGAALGIPPELATAQTEQPDLVEQTVTDQYGNQKTVLVPKTAGVQTKDVSGEKLLTPAELAQKQKVAAAGTEAGASSLLTGSQKGKEVVDLAEDRTNTENFTRGINQLIDFTKSENFVGGFTGRAVQAVNSAFNQFKQITGQKDELVKSGKLNLDNLDESMSAENVSFLRKAAISGDLRESSALKLAYILAKRVDPSGKISDADVQLAREIISGSADQASAVLQLTNIRDSSIRDFNTRAANTKSLVGDEGNVDILKPLGIPSKNDPTQMTDEELLNF